jgi:hypothetical protein
MGFFSGRASFQRFRVLGPAPRQFGPEHLDRLAEYQAGRQRIAAADGIEVGWSAGEHILDTDFELAKNIINDTLHFDLRIDCDKLPSDLLRAYYAVELKALAANNPSGFPSSRQKKEAKEIARERIEQDAKDGRFRKRKCIPVLWDALSNELLFGSISLTHVDRLTSHFRRTFGYDLEAVTAGTRAFQLAELLQRTRSVDDSRPSAFVPGVTPDELVWIADEKSRDFLGNEYLLWLWFLSDGESDRLTLADASEATFMIARTLTLECPRGQTGHETISHDGPSRLPEAKRAVQSGKLPRKVGLIVVRHDQQYEFSLYAESLAVSGLKFPNVTEENARARLEERAGQLRHLLETIDLMYDAFGRVRFSNEWPEVLARMQRWLARGERQAA